jgi:predicted nucleic acid-binding protein
VKIFVESNFVLELALRQEQHPSCDGLLGLAESRSVELLVPAYALIEPYETLIRRGNERRRIQREVEAELRQLARSGQYADALRGFRSTTAILAESIDDEIGRLDELHTRLLDCAVLLPFSETILRLATECRHRHALLPPDSLSYATVLDHLRAGPPAESCFVTRDREGFDDPEIASALAEHHCRLVLEFEGAYQYVLNRLSRRSAPLAGPGPS